MNACKEILSPKKINTQLPLSDKAHENVAASRQVIKNILDRKDARFIMIVGPCSFHDYKANLEYARRLKQLAQEVSQKIFVVMRVYLEKPRTSLGWKGYMNDPDINESFHIEKGILEGREFMRELSEMNLPIATEILSPLSYLYLEDLLSWASIGARTSESQVHREIASALMMPVGFKNSTSGDLKPAMNGILNARQPHIFLGINNDGLLSIVQSKGNPYAHLVLRGGDQNPNYSKKYIDLVERDFSTLNMVNNIIIDCAHGNSSQANKKQQHVLMDVIEQKNNGNASIKGVMLESFLVEGKQPISTQLQYGLSITDHCMGWEKTEETITLAYDKIKLHKSLGKFYENKSPRNRR